MEESEKGKRGEDTMGAFIKGPRIFSIYCIDVLFSRCLVAISPLA